jgi:septal ring factor EnvC (AmiA/AmiB activator)
MVAGCATQAGTSESTSALECGGGAAAGALILCKLFGGNNQACAALAVGAGAAGAAICYSYASKIQKHRRELAGHEEDLDARIRYLRQVNQDTEELTNQLAAKVTALTKSTDQAADALARGQATQAQLAQTRQVLDNEVQAAQRQVNTVAQELQSAQQFRAQHTSAASFELDTEIARLQSLLNQAQRSTSAMASLSQRI